MPDTDTTATPPSTSHEQLVAFLRDRDVPCPLCGYNLRGLTSAKCPECGRELRLGVSPVEPRLGPWITTAVAICGSAGIGLLFVSLMIAEGSLIPRVPIGAALAVWYWIAMIPVAVVVLRARRRFMKWPRPLQCVVAALAAILCTLAVLSFVVAVT